MRIVILSSRFPYPIEKGDKLRLYHQLKSLAALHEIHLFSLCEEEISLDDKNTVQKICKSIHTFRVHKFRNYLRTFRSLFDNRPFQVNYFYSRKIKKQISNLIDEINPDRIYCQLIRMAEYVTELPYPLILDYMDCFSMNYQRRSTFENFPKKQFFKGESKRLSLFEKSMLLAFDQHVIISERDACQISNKENIEVVSNGIDTSFFKPLEIEINHKEMLFVGNMGYHPNVLAATYLVQDILPLLDDTFTIKIAGARPTPKVMLFASEKVEVTGWVDDIRPHYAKAGIFVAPIFSGAGQQNKILEAMAMGKICITTPIVNEAILGQDGKHLLLAKDPTEFRDKILEVIKNPEEFQEMPSQARSFVTEHFSWENENKKLNEIIISTKKAKGNGG